ncbi:5-hydroxytryptamine receptor 1D-like [Dendronephthya gigantea]|uniref:5-hydroxytryptamine receptor 1D-like n=1 Tax=Dendronephthya gigantea TaxID=151771 RepID=UPI00106DCCCC|nr:5-hydroxytryptamine receptor 1D-like [Dendronephthya gigantea]
MSNNSSSQTGWKDGKYIIQEVHYIVLAALIVLVNLFVITTVWRKRILHKWQNYLLVSLACSDLSTGLFGLPLSLLCTLAKSESTGCILCSVAYIFTKFISISTILHLLTVTYERFMYIVYPFHHERLSTTQVRFKLLLAAIWLISFAVAFVPFTWIKLEECLNRDNAEQWLLYTLITLVIFFVIPMFLFIFAFVSMYTVARLHMRRQQQLMQQLRRRSDTKSKGTYHKEARVAVIFVIMWATFVICWAPYFVVNVLEELEVQVEISDRLFDATNVLRYLTSLLNPIMYSVFKKDFCQEVGCARFISRGCCVPYDGSRCSGRREEVQLRSNVAQNLLEPGNHGLITQLSTI